MHCAVHGEHALRAGCSSLLELAEFHGNSTGWVWYDMRQVLHMLQLLFSLVLLSLKPPGFGLAVANHVLPLDVLAAGFCHEMGEGGFTPH